MVVAAIRKTDGDSSSIQDVRVGDGVGAVPLQKPLSRILSNMARASFLSSLLRLPPPGSRLLVGTRAPRRSASTSPLLRASVTSAHYGALKGDTFKASAVPQAHQEVVDSWQANIRGDTTLVGPRPDSWWTGPAPQQCPGYDVATGKLTSLALPNISTASREELKEYFDNTWCLTEVCVVLDIGGSEDERCSQLTMGTLLVSPGSLCGASGRGALLPPALP
jgi:hypothetical protein